MHAKGQSTTVSAQSSSRCVLGCLKLSLLAENTKDVEGLVGALGSGKNIAFFYWIHLRLVGTRRQVRKD